MKNFKSFITEQSNTIAFVFGRFNPPTTGHEKLFEKLKSVAGNNPYRIYASHSQDAKKNPLSYDSKIKFLRKMFPRHARNIIADPSAKTVIHIATALYEQGYNRIIMVAGSDRVAEFETLLKKYNGTQARHGFYQFESIEIVSAGERDPDSEGVTGMSASKLRAAAADNNLKLFASGLPAGFKEVQQLFNELRRSMGLTEESTHLSVKLEPISETREAYVSGNLFKEGDEVIITKTDQIATVTYLGANYIIVEDSAGVKSRKWLNDVELVESKDISRITNVGSTPCCSEITESPDTALANKADKSGISVSILRKVYNRGVAAWKTGHRPGTTPEQWGMARVNSYITKGKGTYYGADKDLREEEINEKRSETWEDGYKRRVVKTTKPEHKEQGYNWRIKGKDRSEITIKLYKEKPSQEEFNKQMKRVAGHEFGEEYIDEMRKSPKDSESGLSKKYVSGLAKTTAKSRAAHFDKTSKMADDDPRAYKPAPGDANAKTKESEHTKKYKAMYGEDFNIKVLKKKTEKVMSESNKRFKTIIRKEKTNVS